MLYLRPLLFFSDMKNLIILVILACISFSVSAETGLNSACQSAYRDIICLRFTDAQQKIAFEKKLNPGNPLPYLLDNYIDFITAMISEEDKDYKHLRENRDIRLRYLAGSDRNSPWYLYSQAEIYLQLGFARVKFGEYINGSMDINRAYRLLEKNATRFPSFLPNQVRLGLLHALVGTVPDKYRWAVTALDFKGTIPQGIGELRQAFKVCSVNGNYNFLLPETAFLLSFVAVNLSGDKKDATRLTSEFTGPALRKWLVDSPLINYCYANLSIKTGNNDLAIATMASCNRGDGRYPFHFLDYVLGVAKLNRLDHDSYQLLMRFVGNFRGKNYIRSAYQHLAWYYLIQGNEEKYGFYMNRILLRGYNVVDNDRQAFNDAKKGIRPDLDLLKARLLFDGGYFERSCQSLTDFASSSRIRDPGLNLEYAYRLARVYDEWGRKQLAIDWYLKTIRLGESSTAYYAANSALHLGMIYENSHQYKFAASYYRKCMDMKFDDYNFSITQKAKSGLNRIGQK